MNLSHLFAEHRKVFSCEIFPPKKTSPIETIYTTLDGLRGMHPDFVSVTFGAGGSGQKNLTCDIASVVQDQYKIPAVAHLACINHTKNEVAALLQQLKAKGIANILALRGDRSPDTPPKTEFRYAHELIAFIKSQGEFHISAACYPEGHPESPDLETDIIHLKEKTDAGAEHLVSQLFFNNEDYFSFLEKARAAGVTVPIQAGIMPVLNAGQVQRMVSLCGASLPRKLTRLLSKYGEHPEALRDAGIAYAIDQIADLIAGGADGIHLYSMNNAAVARRIMESVSSLLQVR